MNHSELLEVTITHNLDNEAEVEELYRRKWIALEWGRKGPDPAAYTGKARSQVQLFNDMRRDGAAVIAAYKAATKKEPSCRLVGLVKARTKFKDLNGLLCLPLSAVQPFDSSRSFLGNLAPRQCTVQPCSNRAKGKLANLVSRKASPQNIYLLHNHDVEWLVTNYLIVTGLCRCVWSGGRSFEAIDHAGWMPDGRELLAQTTISANLVRQKAEQLWKLYKSDRVLHLFGPKDSASQCREEITYHPIEELIPQLRKHDGGKWLVDRMFKAGRPSMTTRSKKNA